MIRPPHRSIHLDTSFLIRGVAADGPELAALRGWLMQRRVIAISALAWGEFLCGPLREEDAETARTIVRRPVPVRTEEASTAADLFNSTGRRRDSLADCIIAATAIESGSELATCNSADFERFQFAGLDLI